MSKIKDQIKPSNWMKGYYCNGVDPEDLSFTEEREITRACRKASRCCMVGWIHRVYPANRRDAIEEKIIEALEALGFTTNVARFNDSSETTLREVKKVLQRANV